MRIAERVCSLAEQQNNPALIIGAYHSSAATPEHAEQRFEHYRLVTSENGKPVELGRGAMGVTYIAFDVDLHCPVTLKIISEKYLGDESARLRFLREARAAASVRQPNVPRSSTWAEPVRITSMRWSSSREKRWRA